MVINCELNFRREIIFSPLPTVNWRMLEDVDFIRVIQATWGGSSSCSVDLILGTKIDLFFIIVIYIRICIYVYVYRYMYIFDEIENSLTWEHKIIRISTRLFPFGDFANIDKYQRRYEKK